MKAVILAAGVGSRIRPLTDTLPKPLLPVGDDTVMGMMIRGLQSVMIQDVAVVTGYRQQQIKDYLQQNFPDLHFEYIHNDLFDKTNTGYSLLLAKSWIGESAFIKFDGDVVFEPEVLQKLVNSSHENCLTIDTHINLAAEEVKVVLDQEGKILKVGKKLSPQESAGESIGIEKVGRKTGIEFLNILDDLMKNQENYQQYYDDTYTTLVKKGHSFHAIDITGLKWVEIDTHEDYQKAQNFFS